MDMRKLVGRNFARLRAERDLTQEAVAERANISQQYVSGLENGKRNPTVQTLFQIAQALGVSHMELVKPDDQGH
ncbi:MAG: XRE family transcriptional regulator [Mesorhizobium sp.]|uniref:helix-turn-helix transcriptional regulator n=1 Tax=Mesorhizobium sp. TaxID=1871066 RepID=UPI000FE9DABE|nr:helix-turn-helix transcriptional regulator [Mesorhizobium sp.]RWP18017.1 MAG: XRE family transcriptional regulator [Mesorhizobium sp.]